MTGDDDLPLVPGRACDGCTMCCKVFPIAETGKADFGLCPHACLESGCSIHAARPDVCREFFCLWRLDASLGAEWKPDIAGFVLHDPAPWSLLMSCDIDRPDAWLREPYASRIRQWAVELQRRQMMMGRRCGNRTVMMLRDSEIEIDA